MRNDRLGSILDLKSLQLSASGVMETEVIYNASARSMVMVANGLFVIFSNTMPYVHGVCGAKTRGSYSYFSSHDYTLLYAKIVIQHF